MSVVTIISGAELSMSVKIIPNFKQVLVIILAHWLLLKDDEVFLIHYILSGSEICNV